jgi:Ubiquitin family
MELLKYGNKVDWDWIWTVVFLDLKDTVRAVKCEIFKRQSIYMDDQRLIFGGVELDGDRILKSCNVQAGETLYCAFQFQ